MIATDRFIYIHLHRSGGTFINEALVRFYPGAQQLGYHLPCRMIPPELRRLPVLGFVRNPYAYYVSWFSFQSSMAIGNALYRHASEEGTLGFKPTLRNLLDLGSDPQKLDRLLALLPEAYGRKGLNLPRAALAPIRGSGVGFYSYLYQYMYSGHSGALTLGRTETLRADFLGFFEERRIPISDGLRDYVVAEAARNESRHRPYADYYDDELRELVAVRDAPVLRAFDYAFAG